MATLHMVRRWVIPLHAVAALAVGPPIDLDLYKVSFVLNEGADTEQRQAACKTLSGKAQGYGQQTSVANSGILEQAVDAMHRYIAEEGTLTECAKAVESAVVLNSNATEYLNTHTDAIEVLVKGLNLYESSPHIMSKLAPHVAGFTTTLSSRYGERVERAGGFDALFRILERYPYNLHVQLAGWQGLSDHAQTPRGAAIVAHHGGPLNGCRYLMEELHRFPAYQPNPSGLTLKYQLLQNINGLLSNDLPDRRYLRAFTAYNLPQALAEALQGEPDRRCTQDVGCRVMLSLIQSQPLTTSVYENFNGIAMAALTTFAQPAQTASVSRTVTDAFFPVLPAARDVVAAIAKIRASMPEPAFDQTFGM